MVGSAFSFSLMSLFVKLVGRSLPAQEIVLLRGVVTLALSYAVLRSARIPLAGNRPGLLAVRGVLGFGAVSLFFLGVIRLPIADATVIHYTNPVFTAAIAALVLAERIGARDVGSLAASLVGVLLVAQPTFLFGGASASLDLVGVLAALGGAILSAGAYVCVRHLSRTEHPLVIVLWFGAVTTLGSIPGAAISFVMPSGWEWAALVGVGVTTHAGQILLTRGLTLERAGRAMRVSYVQIVFAALWGILFLGERPDLWSIAGGVLIVGSTLALGRQARPAADPKRTG
jgi:drug/metabolite transporter (DMT)-like permease